MTRLAMLISRYGREEFFLVPVVRNMAAASATPHDIRELRARVLSFAASVDDQPLEDAIGAALLSRVIARLHQASVAQFLSQDEGFLLTLDHHAIGHGAEVSSPRETADRPLKSHRTEAASVLACLAPHTKCAVTTTPLGASLPAALTTACLASGLEVPPANSPAGLLATVANAVAIAPVILAGSVPPPVLQAVLDATNGLVSFLVGSSGVNPARGGVSLYVVDVAARAPQTLDLLQRVTLTAASKLALLRRTLAAAPNASEQLKTADTAMQALRHQCKVVDERTALAAGLDINLALWLSVGESEAALQTFHENTKDKPIHSGEIVQAVAEKRPVQMPAALARVDFTQAPSHPPAARRKRLALHLRLNAFSTGSERGDESSATEILKQSVTNALDAVNREADFAGTSNTARDVDRLVALTRNIMDGPVDPVLLQRLYFDRKRKPGIGGEPRPLLPVKTSLFEDSRVGADSDDGSDDDREADDRAAPEPTVLERIVLALPRSD
jgi:hypothetical protein